MTFCEMHKGSGCEECPNRYVCKNSTSKPKVRTGRTYKGFNRAQLIDILAEYAVFAAQVNNSHDGATMNTVKSDYVSLYQTYPLSSKKYPGFSLSVMYDKMRTEIEKAKEIASLCNCNERRMGMNNVRRVALRKVIDKIADAQGALEMLKEEEEDYRDSMPENLQGSIRYQASDEACEALDGAVSQLEEAAEDIETAITG